jgi:MFS family permease
MSQPDAPAPAPSDFALSYPSYRFFWLAISLASFAAQIMAVTVALEVYLLTRNPFYLGLIGLALFLPALLLVLVTGLAADRFKRRHILAIGGTIEAGCALALLFYTGYDSAGVWPVFVILAVLGTARAFMSPASSSLAPNVVPREALSSAISLNAAAWQLANIVGPVIGGILAAISIQLAFGVAAAFSVGAVLAILMVAAPPQHTLGQAASLESILAGFRYIWHQKVVLGAISLDLFAVLMGGATALLPVFALDVLHIGEAGLGFLRAAPGLGAIPVALYLARFPVKDHAGRILFVFVALFGLFTAIFGLSTSIWLSFPMLMLMGACDMVSVSIRETIMQLWTPDEVRGRVNAVNSVFIGASNELGEFRAGTTAAFIGGVAAVAIGGFATMGVAAIWSVVFPGLRNQRRLDRREA